MKRTLTIALACALAFSAGVWVNAQQQDDRQPAKDWATSNSIFKPVDGVGDAAYWNEPITRLDLARILYRQSDEYVAPTIPVVIESTTTSTVASTSPVPRPRNCVFIYTPMLIGEEERNGEVYDGWLPIVQGQNCGNVMVRITGYPTFVHRGFLWIEENVDTTRLEASCYFQGVRLNSCNVIFMETTPSTTVTTQPARDVISLGRPDAAGMTAAPEALLEFDALSSGDSGGWL